MTDVSHIHKMKFWWMTFKIFNHVSEWLLWSVISCTSVRLQKQWNKSYRRERGSSSVLHLVLEDSHKGSTEDVIYLFPSFHLHLKEQLKSYEFGTQKVTLSRMFTLLFRSQWQSYDHFNWSFWLFADNYLCSSPVSFIFTHIQIWHDLCHARFDVSNGIVVGFKQCY